MRDELETMLEEELDAGVEEELGLDELDGEDEVEELDEAEEFTACPDSNRKKVKRFDPPQDS